jgi:probable H4MPT-linked C1 transfer pathway protein
MSRAVLGWDVGGANVKAAFLADATATPRTIERPLALWREPQRLPEILAEVARSLDDAPRMAVTMTAELADCYATKRQGVGAVLDAFATAFSAADVAVFGVDGRFHSVAAARRRPLRVAAANWRASATLAAESHPNAVLVDVGSTTTDIIPIRDGAVVARGHTDTARLRCGELVYTGLLRTPVCAIVRSLPWRGRRCRVAAELFAIAADAQRWLGRIAEPDYTCDTADGRGRSRRECGARLARMIGADDELLDAEGITAIAAAIVAAQERQIASGLRQVLRRLGPAGPPVAVLVGQGFRLALVPCQALGLRVKAPATAAEVVASRTAPAVAVATLLARV